MNDTTRTTTLVESPRRASPQLVASMPANFADVTLELADLSVGQLTAVAALMLALDAERARAKAAEEDLARHGRHCICRAAAVAAEGMSGLAAA